MIHAIDELPALGPAALCMGVFDGVHRGHVALAGTTVAAARRLGIASAAIVFEPHPDEVVHPGSVVPRLAPLDENLRRLELAGIEHPLVVRFDPALRARGPEEFLGAMAPAVELRVLVMTPESAFGRNRAGTPQAMRALGAERGFELVVADDVVRDGGAPVSSARVRALLAEGDLATAARLLGHPLVLRATLEEPVGNHRRLDFAYPPALPAAGRYPARVRGGDDAIRGHGLTLVVAADRTASLEGATDAGEGPVTIELGDPG